MNMLESTILQYEKDFFDVDFCCKKDNLENRLCCDFCEYGKSGTIHSRDDVVNDLLNMQKNKSISIHNFSAIKLSENIIMTHYLSHDEATNHYALRTSIWKHEKNIWKMLFHQGTSCDCPE